jgi:hypothetical protein
MKRLLGLAILAVIGAYLWRNHFARLFQPKDQIAEVLEEVQLKQGIGNNKRGVWLAHQFPNATIGDTPYAGVPLTVMNDAVTSAPKKLQLLPKGAQTSPNPFDRVLSWLN